MYSMMCHRAPMAQRLKIPRRLEHSTSQYTEVSRTLFGTTSRVLFGHNF
jgi:hypothetical protein